MDFHFEIGGSSLDGDGRFTCYLKSKFIIHNFLCKDSFLSKLFQGKQHVYIKIDIPRRLNFATPINYLPWYIFTKEGFKIIGNDQKLLTSDCQLHHRLMQELYWCLTAYHHHHPTPYFNLADSQLLLQSDLRTAPNSQL